MGWRFRTSFKILPGVRLNFGKKGLTSASIGKGLTSTNISAKGVRQNFNVPGTGVSYRTDPLSLGDRENTSSNAGGVVEVWECSSCGTFNTESVQECGSCAQQNENAPITDHLIEEFKVLANSQVATVILVVAIIIVLLVILALLLPFILF